MPIPKLSEVCLVANLQTIGPTFISAAKGEIFDHSAGMLLAARIVITSGMGKSTSNFDQLHGPIPISELELEEDYECYFFPIKMQQQPLPDKDFSTGKGTSIITLIIPSEIKLEFRSFEDIMERALISHKDKFDFSQTITGEVPESIQKKFSSILDDIMKEINELLKFSAQFQGGSLFDIGLLATLPNKLSRTAKKIMLNPKGILEDEIDDPIALKTLYQSGLVTKEEREGKVWIIPR